MQILYAQTYNIHKYITYTLQLPCLLHDKETNRRVYKNDDHLIHCFKNDQNLLCFSSSNMNNLNCRVNPFSGLF